MVKNVPAGIGQTAFVRSLHAETLLEDFLVSAVVSLLAIRLYLHITGFPQIAGGTLHIAHMLWGGLLMLAAMVIMLTFLDNRAKVIAAVVGGAGFGAFIDELGKFITRDNDYFFQPAIALIYVIFVLIYFAMRAIRRQQPLSNQECLANIFDIAKQGNLAGLDQEEQADAMTLLQNCESGPVRDNLGRIMQDIRVTPARHSRPVARFHAELNRLYEWAVARLWFSVLIITAFAFIAVTSVSSVVALVEWSSGVIMGTSAGMMILVSLVWSRQVKSRYVNIAITVSIVIVSILIGWGVLGNLRGAPASITDWAQLIFPGLSGALIAVGILTLPRSRLRAYLAFRWAILVSIFFTQVLSFYEHQLLALLGLVMNILILIALRYMIARERVKSLS